MANDGLSATVTVTTALGSLVTLSGVMSPDVADSAGLIAKLMPTADATTAVTNGSTANLPY